MAVSPKVKERIIGGLWAAAWMWPLISPVIALAQGKVSNPLWPALGLATFVGLYIVVVTNGFDVSRHRGRTLPSGLDLALLGALTAVGLTLFIVYADTPDDWPTVMLYVSVAGATTFTPKLAGAWTLTMVAITLGWALNDRSDAHTSGVYALVLGMLMAGALVQIVKQMQRYIQVLRDTRAELARTAVSEERLRFARDLHDLLGHTMSLIVVKAEVVRRLVERDPALARQAAADIEEIGRRALTEVREAVDGYRAPDFTTAVDTVRAALADSGIALRVRHDGPPLPPATSQTFGWVIREAATNAIRHSHAKAADVTLTVTHADAVLEFRDDGRGVRGLVGAGRAGSGLIGLRERVTAAGGTFSVGNVDGGGFRVVATMPAGAAIDTGTRTAETAPGVRTIARAAVVSVASADAAPDDRGAPS